MFRICRRPALCFVLLLVPAALVFTDGFERGSLLSWSRRVP